MKSSQDPDRKRESRLMALSLVSGVLFLGAELAAAVYTGSRGVWADSLFDLWETLFLGVFTSLMVLLKNPHLQDRVRQAFTLGKQGMLVVLLLVLVSQNLQVLLTGGHVIDAHQVGRLEAVLCLLALVVTALLGLLARSTSSPAVRSEVVSWAIDAVGCAGMLSAYALCAHFGSLWPWLTRYADSAIALVLSALSLIVVARMLKKTLEDWKSEGSLHLPAGHLKPQ